MARNKKIRKPSSYALGLAPRLEPLEDRSVPAVNAAFAGTLALNAGTDVRLSSLSANETEVHIAADPTAPGVLMATSNNQNGAGQLLERSADAGANWTQSQYTGDGLGTTGSRFDGAAAVDDFGNIHIVYQWVNASATTMRIIHAVSTNGGATFTPTIIASGASLDKPWVAVGPDAQNPANQAVIVTYMQVVSGNVNLYARGASITGLGAVGAFSTASLVSDSGLDNQAIPAIGPNGEVAIAFQKFTPVAGPPSELDITVMVDRDTDGLAGGLTFGTDVMATETNIRIGTNGNQVGDVIPAQPDRGIHAMPHIVYDRSGGPFNGRLYLVYPSEPVDESNDFAIRTRYSDDNGATFSVPWLVSSTTIRSRFLQTASVDQDTGYLWVSYYDCRNDYTGTPVPGFDPTYNNETQYLATVSVNGGMAFLPEIVVSDGVLSESRANPDGNDYGDYSGIAAMGGSAYCVWADNNSASGNDFDVAFDRVWLSSSGGQNIFATGTAGADTYDVRLDATGVFLQIYENNPAMTGVPTFTATYSAVNKLFFTTGAGDDTLRFDFSNGNPIPVNGYSFDGEADLDKIIIAADRSYTLSDALLLVTGAGDGTLTSVERADLSGGSGANAFTVNNWHGASTLAGGAGVDTYRLTMYSSMGPTEVVETGTPDADVTVTGTSGPDVFTVAGTSVTRGSEVVNFSGVANLTIDGGDGADTFNVTPSATTIINVIGNTPNDSFADYLVLDHAGATSPTLNPTGNRVGNWTYGNRQPVNYSTIEKMTPGASISGRAYLDADRNRIDTGNAEAGIGGISISLYGDAGSLFATATTTASGTGAYTFTDLVPGYHRVRQNHAPGYMRSSDNPANLDYTAPIAATGLKFGSIAASIYWTGMAGDGNWVNTANWSTLSLPGPTDDVGIPAGVGTTNPGNSGITAIKSLVSFSSIGSNGGYFNIALAEPSLIDGDFTMWGSDFSGVGNLKITGRLTWISGSLTGTGETEVMGGVEIATGTYGYGIDQSVLRLHGLSTYAAGFMTIANDGKIIIEADGIMEVDKVNDSYHIDMGAGGDNRITNYGIWRNKNANSGLWVGVPFYNYGQVYAVAGWIGFSGGGVNAASWSGNPGSEIRISGSFGTQIMHLVAGAAGYGDFTTVVSGGTLAVDADTTLRGARLDYGGGSITANANLTLTQKLTFNNGNMYGTGTIYANGGLDVISNCYIVGTTLHVGGSGVWTYGYATLTGGAQFIVDAGGLIDVQNTIYSQINLTAPNGAERLVNNGTFRKNSAGEFVCDIPYTNTGTIDAVSGVFRLGQSGINSGLFTGQAGGTIRITGGTSTFQAGASSATSLGLLHVSGGTVSIDSGVNMTTGALTVQGNITGAGNLIVNDKLNLWGSTQAGSGQTIAAGGAEFNYGHNTLDGRTLKLQGNSLWLYANIAAINAGQLIVDAGAIFDMNIYGNWQGWSFNGSPTVGVPGLLNLGTIRVNNSNGYFGAAIAVSMTNQGLVDVQTGILQLLGGGLNQGTFDGAASGTIQFHYDSFPVVFQTSTVQGSGGVHMFVYNGKIQADANATFKNLDLHAGSLGGAADIIVTDTLDWTAYGSMVDSGRTIVAGTMNVSPDYHKHLRSRHLVVQGVVNHVGTSIRMDDGAKITVAAGGIYNFAPPAVYGPSFVRYYGTGTAELVVDGLLRKTGVSYGFIDYGISVTINGVVQVDEGSDLYFNGGLPLTGGALKGNGRILANTSTSSTSTIAPGLSPGLLTINGNLIYNSASSLAIELNGTTVGTQYDQLVVNGAVNLAGANLNVTRGFSPGSGTPFTILENDGSDAIVGTFNGLAEGATFQVSGQSFTISYVGGSGNDVVLTAGAGGDSTAPTIVGVYFGSSFDADGAGTADTVWTAAFRAAAGNANYGFPAQTGANQLKNLPWVNVDTVYIQFAEDVAIDATVLAVRGINVPNYALSNFAYDNVNFVAKWVLTGGGPGGNLDTDRLILDLDGDSGTAVADLAGNKLAGSWTEGVSAFPSTGAAAVDFKFRFVVGVGDADRNGLVRNNDLNLVRNNLFVDVGQGGYVIYADIDGNGLLRNADLNLVRNRLFVDPPAGPGPNGPAGRSARSSERGIGTRPQAAFTSKTRDAYEPWSPQRRLSRSASASERAATLDALFSDGVVGE